MNLFICMTPLQAVVADKIISYESLSRDSCALIYIANSDNEINRHYFSKLSSGMSSSEYITSGRTLKTIHRLKDLLAGDKCDAYIASVDDSLVHYALSFVRLGRLTTFDDGTANIMPHSTYFHGIKRPFIRGLVLSAFHFVHGKKYSLESIKSRSDLHYTIYKNTKNAMGESVYLNAFDIEPEGKSGGEISLFLGGVYNELATNPADHENLKSQVMSFVNSIDNCRYIPHPRCKDYSNNACDKLISEEVIMSLLNDFDVVRVYGFGSSAQFNLCSNARIIQIPVISSLLKEDVVKTCEELGRLSGNHTVSINGE